MVREYGQVQTGFWAHPEMAGLDDATKLMALYCFTSPHSNALGCFRLPTGYAAADLGWDEAQVQSRMDKLTQVGLALRHPHTGWTLVPNHLRWNPIQNPNVGKAVVKQLRRVPATFSHRDALYHALKRWGTHLPKGWSRELQMGQGDAPATGEGDQEQQCMERNRQRVAELMENVFGSSPTRRNNAGAVSGVQGEA